MDVLPLENGGIRFLEMPGAFYEQLSQLPETCDPGSDPEIIARLYPEPLDPNEPEEDRRTAAEDWATYVRPEMEAAFDRAMHTVLHDLGQAKPTAESFDGTDPYYRVEIPGEHLQFWFQVLNRARIVLALRHGLPVSTNDRSLDDTLTLSRLLAAHLSEHYAEILEILVYQMQRQLTD